MAWHLGCGVAWAARPPRLRDVAMWGPCEGRCGGLCEGHVGGHVGGYVGGHVRVDVGNPQLRDPTVRTTLLCVPPCCAAVPHVVPHVAPLSTSCSWILTATRPSARASSPISSRSCLLARGAWQTMQRWRHKLRRPPVASRSLP